MGPEGTTGTTGAVWLGARRPTARAGVRRSTWSSRPDRRRPLERLRKVVFFFFLGSSLSSSAGKMGRDGDPGTFGDASRAVKHMNDDHIDSLVAWAHYYLNVPTHITDVALVDCTEEGFHLMVEGVWRMIPYPAECKCDSARDLRKVAVYMHNEAFAKLGLAYRLRSGY